MQCPFAFLFQTPFFWPQLNWPQFYCTPVPVMPVRSRHTTRCVSEPPGVAPVPLFAPTWLPPASSSHVLLCSCTLKSNNALPLCLRWCAAFGARLALSPAPFVWRCLSAHCRCVPCVTLIQTDRTQCEDSSRRGGRTARVGPVPSSPCRQLPAAQNWIRWLTQDALPSGPAMPAHPGRFGWEAEACPAVFPNHWQQCRRRLELQQ